MRDYRIDLETAVYSMGWHKFLMLLNGLSPYGALASHYDAELKRQNAEQLNTPDEQKQAAASVWGALHSI